VIRESSIPPSAGKAGYIGGEIGTAKAVPSQNNHELPGIESSHRLFRKRNSKCDFPALPGLRRCGLRKLF
jgi:hypothetical protein